jgi:hypothetical protein
MYRVSFIVRRASPLEPPIFWPYTEAIPEEQDEDRPIAEAGTISSLISGRDWTGGHRGRPATLPHEVIIAVRSFIMEQLEISKPATFTDISGFILISSGVPLHKILFVTSSTGFRDLPVFPGMNPTQDGKNPTQGGKNPTQGFQKLESGFSFQLSHYPGILLTRNFRTLKYDRDHFLDFLRAPRSLLEFSWSFLWQMDSDHGLLPFVILFVDEGPIAIFMSLQISLIENIYEDSRS